MEPLILGCVHVNCQSFLRNFDISIISISFVQWILVSIVIRRVVNLMLLNYTRLIEIMGAVRIINDDRHFNGELANAERKLVVVDFTASW